MVRAVLLLSGKEYLNRDERAVTLSSLSAFCLIGKKMNHKDTKAQRILPVICHNFLSIKDGKGGFIAIGKRASQKG